MIKGLSNFLFFNAVKTENEPERMMNYVNFFCQMMLSAKSITQLSAVEASFFVLGPFPSYKLLYIPL